jgi:uncharacterized Ntn-hydrolase superfamily protein
VTFSIVAHDPLTGDLGVAVASRAPAVGVVVPYARAGIGAMAIQSAGDFTYGPRGLDLIAGGHAPDDVIAALTRDDPHVAYRQVAPAAPAGHSSTTAWQLSSCAAGTGVGRRRTASRPLTR